MLHSKLKREMSIQAALEWAFSVEMARVEFDELNETAGSLRSGVDTIWVLMQRGALGCKVDGGGSSSPAADAEVIASAVTNLPENWGGRSMATQIAALARAGMAPDWMPDARPRFSPSEVDQNRHGWTAKTAEAQHLGARGWPVQERRGRKGRVVKEPVLFCPVFLYPTQAEISRARRRYLDWIGALYWLHGDLKATGILSTIRLTDEFPKLSPWRAGE
jgi:hypothetical protein